MLLAQKLIILCEGLQFAPDRMPLTKHFVPKELSEFKVLQTNHFRPLSRKVKTHVFHCGI
jgi:hypothetical protein